jgi:hypothetical protein
MRLKVSAVSANERLLTLVTQGYELHARLWAEFSEKKAQRTFQDEVDHPRHAGEINTWGQRVGDALGSIFPTDQECHVFMNPHFPHSGGVLSDSYEWRVMMIHFMDCIRGLDVIRQDAISQYTDLPIKERLYVEDVDSFAKVRDVNPGMVASLLKDGYLDLAEDGVQLALEAILEISFHKNDWGGEANDLYTTNVVVNGTRRPTAFMLKGNGLRNRVMEIKHCGKNGDQVIRLFQTPADLFVIQFVGTVAESVIQQAHGEIARLKSQGKEAHFLVMDGQDTARVLHAYGKL